MRLEFKEGTSNKFWEAELSGNSFEAHWGKIGTAGQKKKQTFPSPAAARKAWEQLVAEKKKKGYREVGGAKPAVPSARDAKPEAALRERRDDQTAYLVYSDFLQSAGDPLGELIAVQVAHATKKDAALLKRSNALIKKLALLEPDLGTLEFKWGLLESVRIENQRDWMDEAFDCRPVLEKLFGSAACVALRELRVGVIRWDGHMEDLQRLFESAGRFEWAKGLERLHLGDVEDCRHDAPLDRHRRQGDQQDLPGAPLPHPPWWSISAETAGQCCWPDQVWSRSQSRCLGIPRCPVTHFTMGEDCVEGPAVAPAPAPAVVPSSAADSLPPMVESPPPPPPPAVPVAAVPVAPAVIEKQEPPPSVRAPLNVRSQDVRSQEQDPPPPAVATSTDPRRGVLNVSLLSGFDFSELTQGATLGFEINFLRGPAGTLGLSLGVGVLACVITAASCAKTFVHFPLAFKAGLKLGTVVEWTVRVGAAPAVIWRDGYYTGPLVKFLAGMGFFFETGRGGAWIGFDILPNNGFAHVLSLGWML